MDDASRIRCPQCSKTLAARAAKGRVEVKMKRSSRRSFGVEIVIGAIICPRCDYRLNVPLSAIEVPMAKPLPQKEAPDARGI